MEIIRLTEEQIKQIYTEHLSYDFATNERKPLSAVLKSLYEKHYRNYLPKAMYKQMIKIK